MIFLQRLDRLDISPDIAPQFLLKHPDPRLPTKAGTMCHQLARPILLGDNRDENLWAATGPVAKFFDQYASRARRRYGLTFWLWIGIPDGPVANFPRPMCEPRESAGCYNFWL